MIQYYDQVVPEGQARYEEFYPLGKELILRLYRNQDTSDVRCSHNTFTFNSDILSIS